MDTKWNKWKGAVSFTAFFLAVNFMVAGTFLMVLVPLGGYGVKDVAETDYQNTQAFRDLISENLNALFLIENGGGAQVRLPLRDGPSHMEASTALTLLMPDKNMLFSAQIWNNSGHSNGNPGDSYADTPSGYNFFLHYDGEKAVIWKDGVELDVYGDGYYRADSQWAVPGYSNTEPRPGVTVTLAVIQTPVECAAPLGGSPLYWLAQNLAVARVRLLIGASLAAAGLLLLVLSIVWRKERAEARKAIAVCTGKVWCEVKLLALVPIGFSVFVLAGPLSLYDVMYSVGRFAKNDGNNLEVVLLACVLFYTGWLLYFLINDLRHNRAPWKIGLTTKLFRRVSNGVSDSAPKASALNAWLAARTGKVWIEAKILILIFSPKVFFSATVVNLAYRIFGMLGLGWLAAAFVLLRLPLFLIVIYLFVNDLRLNRGQFAHGLTAYFQTLFRTSEEKYSVRARLTRRAWASFACTGPLVIMGSFFCVYLVATAWYSSERYRAFLVLIPIAFLVLLALLLWLFLRSLATARDIGALADQITAIRAGELKNGMELPKDADLADLSVALSDIRAGMDTALAEQMRSERMRVELIANVSHDLKTPLTSVISYAELLSQEEDLPDHAKDYIRILRDKAERLKTMVQDVFEVSKAASGELNVRLERLDLGKLLRQTLADMSDPIAESGLVFRPEIPEAPVYIAADGDRLYRVFQNLIQNALQYSLDGSRVYVYVRKEDGVARAGMKNTSRAELPSDTDFTGRFVRGDASRTGEGSGLGLAIASSFTASCGGTFTVETDADLFRAEAVFPEKSSH